jgi:ribose transport system substrate-binding protein
VPSALAAHRAPPVVIGYSDPAGSEEGLRGVGWGEKQAIKTLKLPWSVKEVDSQLSADKQVTDIDAMISLKVKGITSWTLDQGAADAAYKRAHDAGIAVIGLNSSSKYFDSSVVGWTDFTCLVSNEQAKFIASLVPHANCVLKAAKAAGLQILAFEKTKMGSQTEGQQVIQGMLLKHPDVQAVWTFSEGPALGALAALRSAGKTIWSGSKKGIVLVSRNGTSAAAEAIRTGNLTATWDNNQPLLGAAAVQLLKYVLVDKVPASKLPTQVPVPSKRWDSTNIATYKSPVSRAVELPLPLSFSGLKTWCASQSLKCTWR